MDLPTYTNIQAMSPLDYADGADQEQHSQYGSSYIEATEAQVLLSRFRSNSRHGRQRSTRPISDIVFPLPEANDTVSTMPYQDLVSRFQIRQIQQTAPVSPPPSARFSSRKRTSISSTPEPIRGISADSEGGHVIPSNSRNQPQRVLTLAQSHLASLNVDGSEGLPVARPQHFTAITQRTWIDQVKTAASALYASLTTPISPYSEFSQARYLVTFSVAATYVLFFPLEFAFPDEHFDNVNGVVGFLLGLDTLIALHTSYVRKDGTIAKSHRDIAHHYLETRFVLDALLVIPLVVHVHLGKFVGDWIHFLLDLLSAERLVYIIRFVHKTSSEHLHQLGGGRDVWAWLFYSRYSHLLRIAGTTAMLVCIAHYTACLWIALLEEVNEAVEDTMPIIPWREQYSTSFYSALLLLQGDGVSSGTAAQNLFASLSVLLGSLALAILFGHVAILVANFNANSTAYQRKMEEVYGMTAKLELPPQLRARIHEYYEHLWHEYECLDGQIVRFSKGLSHTLGLEVVLIKYMEVVMQIPFWKDCTPSFQKQLMLCLDARVYLPNDIIMRQGEVDVEFYMINRGYCELTCGIDQFERVANSRIVQRSPGEATNASNRSRRRSSTLPILAASDGHLQSAYELDAAQRQYYSSTGRQTADGYEVMISRGQAFGDLALLTNYQRAADVRAITHVEMCVLSRDCFQAVLARYPKDRRQVVVAMLSSYMESYEARQLRCPLLELVRGLYSPEAVAGVRAKTITSCPQSPPEITAREAADRIYTAMDVDKQDTTLQFGIGANIREQLVALREHRRKQVRVGQDFFEDLETSINWGAKSTLNTYRMPKPLSWQARLQKVEEREVEMLRALKDLQTNFKLLQARYATQSSTSST